MLSINPRNELQAWVIRHNRHHAAANIVDVDPDLNNKLLAFTPNTATDVRGVRRRIVRRQAQLYPVVALFATVAFRIDAWRYAVGADSARYPNPRYRLERRVELLLLCTWVLAWIIGPTILLGPQRWLSEFVVAQMLLGCHLSWVFAPNHKGMPLFRPETQPSFLLHQVLKSRNMSGGWPIAFLCGGLNYQIEHHLFPAMSRPHLAACRAHVRAACSAAAIVYTEESPRAIVGSVLRALDDIGRAAVSADS